MATLRVDLIRAGFRSENAVAVFFGMRILTTLAMPGRCAVMLEPQHASQPGAEDGA